MLHFNTPEGSKERANTKIPTLEEEINIVDDFILLLDRCRLDDETKLNMEKNIQKFLNHYQNLSHHMHSTCGLYATDKKELATDKNFFQIKF